MAIETLATELVTRTRQDREGIRREEERMAAFSRSRFGR